jgi:FkbM family methyltransferase
MSFPTHDQFWIDTADFVQSHIEDGEKMIAPTEFKQRFPMQTRSYSSPFDEDADFQWAIIHKGMMNEIDYAVLKRITKEFIPVFANEVFVVFSKHDILPPVPANSPHLISFQQGMKRRRRILMDTVRSIKRKIIDRGLGNKEVIKRIPIIGNVFRRFYYRMRQDIPALSLEAMSAISTQLGREAVYLGDFKALTRTIWGQKIYVDTRDISLAPHILLDGYWEKWITIFFKEVIREGMTVVEVGANIGYYTLLAASQIGTKGKLFAFEANPEVFSILFKSIIVNGFLDRTTLINKAVTDKSQKLQFYRLKCHHGSSSIAEFKEEFLKTYHDDVETIEVDAVSLDEYFADMDIKIDFMKIDCEGAEGLVFKGMNKLLEKNPNVKIICEFAPKLLSATGIQPREFLEKIKAQGFSLKVINTSSIAEDVTIDGLLEMPHCDLFLSR